MIPLAAVGAVERRSIRVLCFGRFYDEIPGGMQRHVEHLFWALQGKVEYTHLVPSRDRNGASFRLHGFPVIRRPSWNMDGSLAISPGLVTEAWRLHRASPFDLIHLHFPDPMSHLAAAVLPAEVPRVITWHADVIRQKHLLWLYRPFLRRALENAAAVIVATPYHVNVSPDLSPLRQSNRLHIIPFGLDLGAFARPGPDVPAFKKRFPGKRIFALGRHVYYKGFDILIRAMSKVDQDARLLIGGIGPLTERWKQLARTQGVADRVHFLGLIPEAELADHYHGCDLFCLPSVSPAEAFGIVQVEAMACGKPVVSTRLNNGVEFVNRHQSTGLTVPPGDPDALAGALNRLLSDAPLREDLGRRARERAFGVFSAQAMGQQTLALYHRVLEHRSLS